MVGPGRFERVVYGVEDSQQDENSTAQGGELSQADYDAMQFDDADYRDMDARR